MCESGTPPPERVLERLGFEREGVKRRYLRHDNERVDATLFSLLPGDAVKTLVVYLMSGPETP